MYRFDKDRYFKEFEDVFSKYPTDVDGILREYDKILDNDLTPYENKANLQRLIAEKAKLVVFKTAPFFFEVDTGRNRNSVTSTWPPEPGLADAFMSKNVSLLERYNHTWLPHFADSLMINGVMFSDTAHHYANVEKIMRCGLKGIREEIVGELEKSDLDEREERLLNSMLSSVDSIIHICRRFTEEIGELITEEKDPELKENLEMQYSLSQVVPL